MNYTINRKSAHRHYGDERCADYSSTITALASTLLIRFSCMSLYDIILKESIRF